MAHLVTPCLLAYLYDSNCTFTLMIFVWMGVTVRLRRTVTPIHTITYLRNGLQVQDDLFDIGGSIGAAARIGVGRVGPAGEVPGGVLVVVRARPQRDEGLVLDEDLLDTVDGLLLHVRVGG